jgi:hypothetical protein
VTLPVVVLDCLGDSIEVPLLSSGVGSPSLQPNIVSTVAFSNSVEWKLGDQIEWSIDIEAKVLVNSLGLDWTSFVNIKNSPSLVLSTVVSVDTYCLSFSILGTSDIKYFTVLPIDELAILILEYLEPSGVSAPDLHVVGSASALDIP